MERVREILTRMEITRKSSANLSPDENVAEVCSICHDKGFVIPIDPDTGKADYSQVVPCRCRQQSRLKDILERYSLYFPSGYQGKTLDNFLVDSSDLGEAHAMAREVAEETGKIKCLTILSLVDRGKTHLAVGICRRWLERGRIARFAYVPDLLNELRTGYDVRGEDSYNAKLQLFCEVPLLVLDDLGTGRYTDWAREQLLVIADTRLRNGKYLVITSNNEIDCLLGDDTESAVLDCQRLNSRIRREEWCCVVGIQDVSEHRLRKGK